MAEFAAQLQRVVNLCTTEATEYERAQRLGLLQPSLDALTQSATGQQHAHFGTQRANVLLRPLAAHQTGEDAAQANSALADAANAAALQPTPAAAGVLPNPLLMTPAGAALLQTPASNAAAWAALRGPADASAVLGLSPAVALAGVGVRPVAAFPHFLSGMMGTPMMQPAGRPGAAQLAVEIDDGKTSKKRQGYHIEPAALQKLIEKQQLEAQRKQQQEQQQQAAAAAAAGSSAAASQAAADGSTDEPPPRQAQQQHRPRVMSRLPPQVREQAERQAADRIRKQMEEEEEEGADGDHGSGSSRQHSTVGGGSSAAAVTAADCLESPNGAGLGGLGLPVGPELDPRGQGIELDLEAGKLFGSAQKRLRLSLCDENGALLPGGQPLITPVVLPTPSPAIAASGPGPALAGGVGGDTAAAGGSSTAAGAASQEAPTPSKFFTGSPVPQTERRAFGEHRAPETPVALGAGPQPARQPDLQQALGTAVKAPAGGSSSSWVPVPGQAPAVLGATPIPAPPAASEAMDDLTMDPAAAAAMPVPESPVKQVAVGHQEGSGAGGSVGGSGDGGMVLQTPDGQEQAVAATPVTGL